MMFEESISQTSLQTLKSIKFLYFKNFYYINIILFLIFYDLSYLNLSKHY